MKRETNLNFAHICLLLIGFILFDHTVFSLVNRSHNNIKYETPPVNRSLLGPGTVLNKFTDNDITQPFCAKSYP